MAAISLRNIVVRFSNGNVALDGVSLDVADGEFLVLVGPTGCGKSTLLRIVAGLDTATSGDVLINNERVNLVKPEQRNVAMVFQRYALYPHLTAYENIAFPLRNLREHNQPEIDALVREASQTLALGDVLQSRPTALSGGEQQRVAMARAMVRRAGVLLLDEPLSNLDAHVRRQMRSEMKTIQKLIKLTTLYVTHDQTEAMSLADRIAVLDRGVLQQVGPPREIYDNPANLFVGGFIGLPPMSFLPATVAGDIVELSFGRVRISPRKAACVAGRGEYVAGLRPEEAEASLAYDSHEQYLPIPVDMPATVHPDLVPYEQEVGVGWLHTSFGLRTESTARLLDAKHRPLYVNGDRLHLVRPGHR